LFEDVWNSPKDNDQFIDDEPSVRTQQIEKNTWAAPWLMVQALSESSIGSPAVSAGFVNSARQSIRYIQIALRARTPIERSRKSRTALAFHRFPVSSFLEAWE
jgi:hypothetical protein